MKITLSLLLYLIWDLYPDIYKRNYTDHCMDILDTVIEDKRMQNL